MKTLVINNTNSQPVRTSSGLDNSNFVYNFPINAEFKNCEIAVSSLSVYYSWVNISSALGNNTFSYVWYSGAIPTATTISITLPDGFYQVSDINSYIQGVCISNGHYLITATGQNVYFIELVENSTYYAVQMNLYQLPTAAQAAALGYTAPGAWPGYVTANITPQLIIPATNIRNLLGFNNGTYPSPTQATTYSKVSDFVPQVSPVQSALISCSLVSNPYSPPPNNIIFSFAPSNVTYGSIIQPAISNLIWNQVLDGYYTNFRIQFLDQSYNPLLLKDTNLVLVLSIRDRPKLDL